VLEGEVEALLPERAERADLALGRIVPPRGHLYASLVRGELTWPEPSELARRDDVAQQLWCDSAVLTGMA